MCRRQLDLYYNFTKLRKINVYLKKNWLDSFDA